MPEKTRMPSTARLRAATVLSVSAALAAGALGATPASAASVATWDKVAQCESGGDWSIINSTHTSYGGLQINMDNWRHYGGTAYAARPDLATKKQQILIAELILKEQGARAWTCAPGTGLSTDKAVPYPDEGAASTTSPLVNVGDINGNGVSDLLARRKSDGHALVYWGKGDGTYTAPTDLGGGWGAYDVITGVGDINGNKVSDLLVRRKSDGHALVYWGKGDGGYTDPTDLGAGWDAYDSITGVGDINGNGVPDLLVRRKSDGHALVYWGKGDGGFTDPTDLGAGWDAYDVITNAGDLNGNGVSDLLVRRKSDGHALVYWGKGDGTYTDPTDLGGGWDGYDVITGVGDINGNKVSDLLVRRKSDGHALVYWGKGDGGFTDPTDLGAGWDSYS
ncbi:FG-GAP-like repeat-containing protein [Streptomyces sp. NPDC020379]|uniref:FG-GAP-like repeat-containing protein n=1 Tax=Streptomyces sp. NPDC020379 TaxID=3365071 RepID=UPI0037994FC0